MTVHLRLKVKGTPDAIDKFHKAMFEVDGDWPFAGVGQAGRKGYECCKCSGRMYTNAKLAAADIKRLAPQFGVHVKVKQFSLADKCLNHKNIEEYYVVGDASKTPKFCIHLPA